MHRIHYQKEQIVKELFIEPMILSTSLETLGIINGHVDGKIVAFNISEEIIENNVENDKVKESENEDDDMKEEESDASNMTTLD